MFRLILVSFSLFMIGCSSGFSPQNPVIQDMSFPNPIPSPSPAPVVSPSPTPPPSAACATPVGGTISIASFNVDPTGVQDSTVGIQAALDCAQTLGINVIVVPNGQFIVSSDQLPYGIQIHSNQVLIGNGPTLSVFKAAPGKVVRNMFAITDASSVTISSLGFQGNGLVYQSSSGPLTNYGRAMTFSVDTNAVTDMGQLTVSGSAFENFASDCWVCFQSYSQDFGMLNITVSNNTFTSHAGNAANPSIIGYVAMAVDFGGTHLTPNPTSAHPYGGSVYNVLVQGNQFTIPHIKQGIGVWSSVNTVLIENNTMNGVGVSGDIPDDVGAYAILVYNDAYEFLADGSAVATGGLKPANVTIHNNQLLGVHSCGVYSASADSIYIDGNTISGQYDMQNGTLPKGAISLNSPTTAVATNNTILNSKIGMTLSGRPTGGSTISTAGNSIQVAAGGYGIWVNSYAGDLIQISQTTIDTSLGGTPYYAPFTGGTIQYVP